MKKIVYIFMWMVLGFFVSIIAHGVIEISYIRYALNSGIILENQAVFGYGYCALPAYLQAGLLILGIIGGFFSGRHWWHVIYPVRSRTPRGWPRG